MSNQGVLFAKRSPDYDTLLNFQFVSEIWENPYENIECPYLLQGTSEINSGWMGQVSFIH